MKRNVLLLEDNEKSRKILKELLKEIDSEITVLEADNLNSAYGYAMQYTIHLFILDIIIDTTVRGDTSGVTFASHIREIRRYKSTPIIFISYLEDPKLFAYSELHCFQYIEKPYNSEKVIYKIKEALGLVHEDEKDKCVCFRKDGLLFPVKVSNVIFVMCEKPYTRIYMINDILEIAYQPLRKIIEKLNSDTFVLCNRSTLVNKDYIVAIDIVNKFLKMKYTDKPLPLGEVYGKILVSEMKNG